MLAARAACSAEPAGSTTGAPPAEGGGDITKLLMRAALRPVRSAPDWRALRASFELGSSEEKEHAGPSHSEETSSSS